MNINHKWIEFRKSQIANELAIVVDGNEQEASKRLEVEQDIIASILNKNLQFFSLKYLERLLAKARLEYTDTPDGTEQPEPESAVTIVLVWIPIIILVIHLLIRHLL